MKVVVDSNIVFSAILNTQSRTGQVLINGTNYFTWYSTALLKKEIEAHKEKICALSGFSQEQFELVFHQITKRIIFVDEVLLSNEEIARAYSMVKDIDENDTLFVALSNKLNAPLWTGDKKLSRGLINKGFTKILTTEAVYGLFLNHQLKTRQKKRKR